MAGTNNLGEMGVTVVRTTLQRFSEKKLLGKPRLTLAKYLGAYTTVAGQGSLIGLRFQHAPLAAVKLVCDSGRESDFAERLRVLASKVVSEFHDREPDFLDVSMGREELRILGAHGKAGPPDNPIALERFKNGTTVDLDKAYANLVACFSLFLGLGLFEPDWIRPAYLRFAPDKAQMISDTQQVAKLVKGWVTRIKPSMVPELFTE